MNPLSFLLNSLLLLLSCASLALAKSSTGSRVLVVADDNERDASELFWESLKQRDYRLTFRLPKDDVSHLAEFGENAFDHLIFFAPSKKNIAPDLSPQSLVTFLQSNGNILFIVSPDSSDIWRDWAREFEVDFDDRESKLFDHFNYISELDDGSHTTLALPSPKSSSSERTTRPVISEQVENGAPILYKGIAHKAGRIPLLLPILNAPSTSYSAETLVSSAPDEDILLSGSSATLVSGFQTRNNARVTFVGSPELFSDSFATTSFSIAGDNNQIERSGNVAFIKDVTQWAFQEKAVLKTIDSFHIKSGPNPKPLPYRVREEITYGISLSHYSNDRWSPFETSDLQLEFTMLEPHLRLPLQLTSTNQSTSSSLYTSTFLAPDRHGVFTFRVDYRRPGWSYIEETSQASVTPPRHDEYERFIRGAAPFYAGAFSVALGFLVFVVAWSNLSFSGMGSGGK